MSEHRDESQHISDELAAEPGDDSLDAEERLLLAAFESELHDSPAAALPVQLTISWAVAWSIVGAIQLACRTPDFTGSARELVEGFARHLEKNIVVGPASAAVATKGWETAAEPSLIIPQPGFVAHGGGGAC